jgi:hypothetical protein
MALEGTVRSDTIVGSTDPLVFGFGGGDFIIGSARDEMFFGGGGQLLNIADDNDLLIGGLFVPSSGGLVNATLLTNLARLALWR